MSFETENEFARLIAPVMQSTLTASEKAILYALARTASRGGPQASVTNLSRATGITPHKLKSFLPGLVSGGWVAQRGASYIIVDRGGAK